MASKLLQGIGVLALIVLVGGSFAALSIVSQRVNVTIAAEEDAASRGPDPTELLRADVAQLAADVGSLGEGHASQLQTLHDAIESAAAAREEAQVARMKALESQIAALRARVEQDDARIVELREALQALSAQLGGRPVAGASPTPPPVAVETPPTPIPVVTETPVEPPAEAKKGFLSFKLPSQSFAFDKLQRLSIVPSLSRVGFDAKSTLHDFTGVTQKVEGELVVDLSKPGVGCKGSIQVETLSLDTGLADRDAEMRKQLDSAAHPRLTFEWTAFEPTSSDAALMRLAGNAKGKLTIHGVAREVSMPVRVSVDASKRVSIEGEAKIKMSDFGVKPPSQLGLISVEDELKIWIALRARSLGVVQEASGG